jgi:hypothetical protein
MKNKFHNTLLWGIFLCLLFSFQSSFAQKSVKKNKRPEDNKEVYFVGEELRYDVHYGFIHAGDAVVSLDKNLHDIRGRKCYKIEVKGTTRGVVRWTFQVDDLWRAYVDSENADLHRSFRSVSENKYKKTETVDFDHVKQKAFVYSKTGKEAEKNQSFDVPKDVKDMISGYYLLRGIDFENTNIGDTITIPSFHEDKSYDFQVIYLGKADIKTKLGKFKTYVLTPIMPENGLFDGKHAIKFWVSDDKYRIPLKIKASMFVGSVEVDIYYYTNQEITRGKK